MDRSGLSAQFPGFPRLHNMTWLTDEDLDDDEASEIAKMSRGMTTFIAVLFIGYLVLGLTGNFLTILALLRCPRVRNVTAAFIISLCVADFLFCVLVLPWEVSRFLAREWIWGEGWICTVFPLLRYWNVAVSLLSIAMITINRYIMIAHFSVYKIVYRKGWIALMIAFCWTFAFVMLLPTLLGKWGRFGFDSRLQTCSIIDDKNKSPKQVLFGLGFCVPAIIIIICYSLIFYVIHKSEKRMREHSSRGVNGTHHGPSLQPQPRITGKIEREVRRRRNEWRITKMVLIIFIAFVVTYLPITLVKSLDKKVEYPGLHVLGYVLIYVSSCINPVIYVIMNRQYRQAYKTVLLCKRPRLPSLTSSHTDTDKTAHCSRYESIRCEGCMLDAHSTSPPPPPPPPSPSPSSSRSPPSSLSFHDVYLFFKRPLDRCLNEIVSFINFVTAAPTPSCKNCQRLRATHKSNCAECQTKMNTRRNTLLDLECAANPKKVLQTPAEVEDSQAFVDHLLHLDSPRPQHRIGRGGIELHSGHNLSVNSPSQLIQVNKSARSLNAVGLEQGRSETNPVMVKGRSHSDSSYPVGRHTKRRHLDLRSQAIRGSNITSTSSLVPERSLTVTSQPRLHHRSSSRRRGDRNANLRHGNPQPPVVDSTSQPKFTFGSYETFSNSGSSSVDSSLHFPPSSDDKNGGSSERTNSFFIPPFVSSSSLLSSSSTSTSTSLPHGGHLKGGRSGASPRLTPAHKHGFDNPLFQNP